MWALTDYIRAHLMLASTRTATGLGGGSDLIRSQGVSIGWSERASTPGQVFR